MGKKDLKKNETPSQFKVGAVCLAFLILGYQTAVFVHRAAVLRIEANRDRPDTVYVYGRDIPLDAEDGSGAAGPGGGNASRRVERVNSEHSRTVEQVRKATRRVENFRFNPNTVTEDELVRLGFSPKQAESIAKYRGKGGRFRRKSDFASSFVVADSVYERLEPYIDIPLLDINRADSASFDALPGIGGYFASRMVEYRGQLGGYSYPEQLMDIYRFDRERYDALADLIECSRPEPFALWSLPEEGLARHPYIRSRAVARAIILFRENSPADSLTVPALERAGILGHDDASKLSRCVIGQ